MSLDPAQAANTVTPVFDIEYRWFAGPAYAVVAANGVGASFATWTAPATGKPSTWTEITAKVSFAGSLTQTWSGAVSDWRADIHGWDYDAALLAEGNAIVCWQRIYRPTGTTLAPAGWQAWQLRLVGALTKRKNQDDFRHGFAWSGTLVSYSSVLANINAPRLTAGRISLTDGATATASPELAQVGLEADQGEFTGGTAAIEPANVVDGNRNTLYISNAIPTATRPAAPAAYPSPRMSELMITPLAGWSAASAWWGEFIGGQSGLHIYLAAWNGGDIIWARFESEAIKRAGPFNEYGVICGNRIIYDLYTGAGNSGASNIIDLSEHGTIPAGWFDDGMIVVATPIVFGGYACAWAPGGASRKYDLNEWWSGAALFWDGPTLNRDNFVAGQSWVSDLSGNSASAWSLNATPHPGSNSAGTDAVWVKCVLPENECYTIDAVSASTDPIRLTNYRGWLATGTGQGVISSKVFTWQYRDANGLHGITWVSAPAAPIPANTRCYPYANSLAQTGYPVTATHINRRKQPAIKHYKVYWSPYGTTRDFSQTGWAADYYTHFHETQENTQALHLSDLLGDGTLDYYWVHSFMYLIYGMADDGRAKVNEIEADLAQMALDITGSEFLDGVSSWRLARYLVDTWAGLATEDFGYIDAKYYHPVGAHALAIAPVNNVLGDLARATGCICAYPLTGGISWITDPWWPWKTIPTETTFDFTTASVRGVVGNAVEATNMEYLILNALSLEDTPHTIRVVYPQPYGELDPPTAAITTEVGDLVVATDAGARLLAQIEFERRVIGTETLRLTVKGVGEWCAPAQRVTLTWALNDDERHEVLTVWLIESVTTTTALQPGGVRTLTTVLDLRRFRG